MEVAKIVSITPEQGLSSVGGDARREPMAEVEYNDGTRGGPFPLASFQPLLDLDELNRHGRDEWDVHRQIVRELEAGVENRDWWLWLHIDESMTGASMTQIIEDVERWLSLNPDHVGRVIEREYVERGLVFRLRAWPRKREFRGEEPLFGNPFPAIAEWTGR
jgi:hypothetical protein